MQPIRTALVALLICSGALFAKAPAAAHYVSSNALNVETLLQPPPAPGSQQNNADIRAVLERQHTRTWKDVLRARSEVDLTPAAFAPVLGRWFSARRLPLTFTLLNNAAEDAEAISGPAKAHWHRRRPPYQDQSIHPVVPVPANASYPSGHAMRGALWATLLAKLAPDRESALIARGEQIGDDRVLAGVHFPTDVLAGRELGRAVAKHLFANRAFHADFNRARVEFAAVRPRSNSWLAAQGHVDWE